MVGIRAKLSYPIYAFIVTFSSYMSYFNICMCLGGDSLEVSSQSICNNSICFVIIKKGKIVGPKAISPGFDDNKPYVVMMVTSLFNKVLGKTICCITAPSQDSHIWKPRIFRS